MKPAINLPGLEEEGSSLSMPSSLSSSSILDSPHSFIDSNFTLSKSFDPFDYTYLNNLISTTPSAKSTPSTACSSIPPSLWTKQSGGLSSYSVANGIGGDMRDQDGEDDYADTKDHYPPHYLIDLDLLDDNAMDSMMAAHSELESPLPTCPANKCRVGAPSPVIVGAGAGAGAGAGTGLSMGNGTIPVAGMMNHHLLHLPYLFISSSSSSSSSSCSSSVTAAVNIWSNNYYRYHDPFDDDEFDPTQPASLSLSSDISVSPQFTYASPCQPSSSSAITTAIDMLMDLFPHYTQQQIDLTLSKANYDMDRFLELVSSDDGGVSYSKKKQVCRHFLSGDCHRQDCRFAHDINIKVCKFWLQGGCLKGPQCEFAHSLEPICVRSPLDPASTTTTARSPKSKSSKNKSKPSSANKSCVEDHYYTLNGSNLFADGGKQRRQKRKKIKRKNNTSANEDSSSPTPTNTISSTSHHHEIHHSPSLADYPLDEDFPTLLSSSKSSANSSITSAGVRPLHVPNLSSTNFAQVVARSKLKN